MFKIYYADGTTFQGNPEMAPARGVVCILQKRADGRHNILSEKSHYVWSNDFWIPCTWDDVEEYLLDRRNEFQFVIRGRVIDCAGYWKIFDKAKKDMNCEALD